MNGEQLTMTKGETELEMVPYVEGGEMVLLWQLHREGLGNALEITTGESPAFRFKSILFKLKFKIFVILCRRPSLPVLGYLSLWAFLSILP